MKDIDEIAKEIANHILRYEPSINKVNICTPFIINFISEALLTIKNETRLEDYEIAKSQDNRCFANQGSATGMQYQIAQAIREKIGEKK